MPDKPTYARANHILDRTCQQYGFDPIDVRLAVVKQLHEMAGARIKGGSKADINEHAALRQKAQVNGA